MSSTAAANEQANDETALLHTFWRDVQQEEKAQLPSSGYDEAEKEASGLDDDERHEISAATNDWQGPVSLPVPLVKTTLKTRFLSFVAPSQRKALMPKLWPDLFPADRIDAGNNAPPKHPVNFAVCRSNFTSFMADPCGVRPPDESKVVAEV